MVVLDLMMPGMDGFEVLDTMRLREAGWRDIPVVVVTAKDAAQPRRSLGSTQHAYRSIQKGAYKRS